MINIGVPILLFPAGSGGGGSRWYAPLKGAPATLPIATGSNALSAGQDARATGADTIGFGRTTRAIGPFSVCVGAFANSHFSSSGVAVGYGATTGSGAGLVSIGINSSAYNGGIAAGATCSANGAGAVVVGDSSSVGILLGQTVGYGNSVSGALSTIIGAVGICTFRNSQIFAYLGTTCNDNEMQRTDVTVGYVLDGRELDVLRAVATANAVATPFAGIAMPDNAAATFTGRVSAYRTAGAGVVGDSAAWVISGLVKQVAGVYTLVGFAGAAPVFFDVGAAGWLTGAAIVGNRLEFNATGQAGENIDWELSVTLTVTN